MDIEDIINGYSIEESVGSITISYRSNGRDVVTKVYETNRNVSYEIDRILINDVINNLNFNVKPLSLDEIEQHVIEILNK